MFATGLDQIITAQQVILALCGVIIAVSTAAAAIKKMVVDPFIHQDQARIDRALEPVMAQLEDIEVNVADIRHEVNDNNGNSLKDAVKGLRREFDEYRKANPR